MGGNPTLTFTPRSTRLRRFRPFAGLPTNSEEFSAAASGAKSLKLTQKNFAGPPLSAEAARPRTCTGLSSSLILGHASAADDLNPDGAKRPAGQGYHEFSRSDQGGVQCRP